jgi:RNA polymerase sigma factor (sigma-70 family)
MKPERAELYLSLVTATAAYMLKKLQPKRLEFSDLVSYGTIGLLEAAARFDPGRGVQFSTFAYPRIRGAILDAVRAAERQVPSNGHPADGDDGLLGLASFEALPDEAAERLRIKRALHLALWALPEVERRLVEGHHLKTRTLADLATEENRSPAWACRRLREALRRLRDTLLRADPACEKRWRDI